jgi:WD40 repeat protein
VRVWDVNTALQLELLTGHEKRVQSVVALPNSSHALTCSEDNTLEVWNIATGPCLMTIPTDGHRGIRCATLARGGAAALSGHEDGRIGMSNLTTGKWLATIHAHASQVII